MLAHSGYWANPHLLTVAGAAQASKVTTSSPVSRLTERLTPFCTLKRARFYQKSRPGIPKHLQNIPLPIDLTGFLNL
jgi:hypothetical protein